MKMKKIIAAVLSAATVLTMSVAASAETIEDVINSENAIERKTESRYERRWISADIRRTIC